MTEKLLGGLFKIRPARAAIWRRCPDEMQLADFAEGNLHGQARSRLEDHLATCRTCRDHVGFLTAWSAEQATAGLPAEVIEKARGLVAPNPSSSLALSGAWAWRGAAVAAVFVLVALVARQPEPVLVDQPVSRQAPAETAQPAPPSLPAGPASPERITPSTGLEPAGPHLLAPAEGASLSTEELVVRWRGVPGTVFYEVQLTTPDGTVIARERTGRTALRLPAKVFAGGGGGLHYVWVRAHLPNGKALMSEVVGFQVVAK